MLQKKYKKKLNQKLQIHESKIYLYSAEESRTHEAYTLNFTPPIRTK